MQMTVRQVMALLRGNAGLMDKDPLWTAADILGATQPERILFGADIEQPTIDGVTAHDQDGRGENGE